MNMWLEHVYNWLKKEIFDDFASLFQKTSEPLYRSYLTATKQTRIQM